MDKKDKKVERSRSGSFPTVDLEEAVVFMQKGSSIGWNMSKDTFATAIGGKTANSGAFLVKLAALRDYGLIERGGDVRYTQLSKEIVAPSQDDSAWIKDKLQEAFLKSDVFRKLYEKIKDASGEPSFATIANSGVHDFHVSVSKKDLFARNFVSSAKYAGLIEDSNDGKIKVIKVVQGFVSQSNINHFGLDADFSKQEQKKALYTFDDSGDGWSMSVRSKEQLTSKIKKMLIDISELLEEGKQE